MKHPMNRHKKNNFISINKLIAGFVLSAVLTCNVEYSHAQTIDPKYVSIFIYTFANGIQWEEDNSDDFVIGVVGIKSDLMDELNKLSTLKKVKNRNIRIQVVSSPEEKFDGHILYVSRNQRDLLNEYNSALSPNTLLISEFPNACNDGALINLVISDNKLKYELSLSKLENKDFKIPAKLKSFAIMIF